MYSYFGLLILAFFSQYIYFEFFSKISEKDNDNRCFRSVIPEKKFVLEKSIQFLSVEIRDYIMSLSSVQNVGDIAASDVMLGIRRLVEIEIVRNKSGCIEDYSMNLDDILGISKHLISFCFTQQVVFDETVNGKEGMNGLFMNIDNNEATLVTECDPNAIADIDGRVCIPMRDFVNDFSVSQPHILRHLLFQILNMKKLIKYLSFYGYMTNSESTQIIQHSEMFQHTLARLISKTKINEFLGFDPKEQINAIQILFDENNDSNYNSDNSNNNISPLQFVLCLSTVFACDEMGFTEIINVDLWDILKWYPLFNHNIDNLNFTTKPLLSNQKQYVIHVLYLVSHLIYILSGYSPQSIIHPCLLPKEFIFLFSQIPLLMELGEVDAVGEGLDCLNIFFRGFQNKKDIQCSHILSSENFQQAKKIQIDAENWLFKNQNQNGGWSRLCTAQDKEEDYCVEEKSIHSTFAVLWGIRGNFEQIISTSTTTTPMLLFLDIEKVLLEYPSFVGFDFQIQRN
eukprot:c30447_g1_i1.p1 GENE.c30447_g1_i1~~c30447_g1_i1.p1  ORF type:complete len:529 (+),score=164.17 c30447_g1_i1:53-1588(+)